VDLVGELNHAGVDQHVTVLHACFDGQASFEAPVTALSSKGIGLPGVRMDAVTLQHLRRSIGTHAPDIVQAHGGEAFKYAIAAMAGRDVPVVYRRIGASPTRIHRGARRVAHGWLMRRAARVVAVAEAVRRETIDIFRVEPQKVVTIPRGIDSRRLSPTRDRAAVRREFDIDPSAPVILSLGSLTPEKNPLGHLHVTRRVVNQMSDAVHLFAGDGPLHGELAAAAKRFALEDNVRLLGNRPDVGDLITASDVMILASETEGMPGCLIEAGMVGIPVAAYEVVGVPEVVVDGETGFLVPPGNIDVLADRTLALLSDPGESRRMGAAARRFCRPRFDIRTVAARYLKEYGDLTNSVTSGR
jgi:glycosyltransferase involved in cell wall biosynthesis